MARKAPKSATSSAKKPRAHKTRASEKQVQERTWYEQDPEECQTASEKNDRLSDLLRGVWNALDVTSIRRIEIGSRGWEATYRVVGA